VTETHQWTRPAEAMKSEYEFYCETCLFPIVSKDADCPHCRQMFEDSKEYHGEEYDDYGDLERS
jgi:hypothetical protein